MTKNYVKMLIRFSVIFVAVLAIAYINTSDTDVLAITHPAEARTDAEPEDINSVDSDIQHIADISEQLRNDGTDIAAEFEPIEQIEAEPTQGIKEEQIPDDTVTDADDPAEDSSQDDLQTEEGTESLTHEQELTPTPEPTPTIDPEDPALYAGLSKLEAAELHAFYDETYKKSSDYISALLVTASSSYDEKIVAEALSVPTEDNDARYTYITGKGYKAYTTSDMPEGFKSQSQASKHMVTFDVPVWRVSSSTGRKYASVWSITVNEKLASSVRCIFSDIYQLDIKFPFNYLKGFMYRKVGGSGLVNSKLMSAHSFGVAIDINYWDDDNDYYLGKGNDLRNKDNQFCIPDEVIDIFAKYGWYWGGDFDICADTMHFQYIGLDFLQYDSDEPFPILYYRAENMSSEVVTNLTERLTKLGYLQNKTSHFGSTVDKAVRAFQEDYGLEPDGIVDYETWEPLINATHDMSYVF